MMVVIEPTQGTKLLRFERNDLYLSTVRCYIGIPLIYLGAQNPISQNLLKNLDSTECMCALVQSKTSRSLFLTNSVSNLF